MKLEPWAEPEIDRVSATAQYQVVISWQAINQKVNPFFFTISKSGTDLLDTEI
jgi:hypothetical protein